MCVVMQSKSANDPSGVAVDHPRRAIIAGYGPVGRFVADRLEKAGFELTLIELNEATVERQRAMGRTAVFGDCTDPAVLEAAGIRDADALILSIPVDDKVIEACGVARKLSADIFISARTNHMSKGMLARHAGANDVVVEEIVTAEAMQKSVVAQLMEEQ